MQITYSYTMSNGNSNSATAYFSVAAPTNVSATITQQGGRIINPPNSLYQNLPTLVNEAADGTQPGILLIASATFPSGNNGGYQWVQLINKDATEDLGAGGPSGVSNAIVGAAELDGGYPYGHYSNGTVLNPPTVTMTNVANDTAQDGPAAGLDPKWGEFARSFGATMYLMWTPTASLFTGCPTTGGNVCAIPVPLGSVSWQFAGDAFNSLQLQQVVSNGVTVTFPLWILNVGKPSNQGFQQGGLSPSWTATYNILVAP